MTTTHSADGAVPLDRVWPDEFFTDLDHNCPVPLYYQVSTRLERAICDGDIPAGARLENEVAIAQRLGVSRATARRSIQALVDKGLLVRRRGIGTQVVQGQVPRPLELSSLYDELKETDRAPATRVLLHEVLPATGPIAEKLRVPEGDDVLHIRRLRTSDGGPVAILENYLPGGFLDLSAGELAAQGLYQLFRARGVAIRVANQAVGARLVDAEEADLLGITPGDPVLTMECIAFDDSGDVVEYGTHCYRPDLYAFETTLVAK